MLGLSKFLENSTINEGKYPIVFDAPKIKFTLNNVWDRNALERLLSDAEKVSGKHYDGDFTDLKGQPYTFEYKDGDLYINDVKLLRNEIIALKGKLKFSYM